MTCNQSGCGKPAAFRFTWPGKDEAGICAEHAERLRHIAAAMGLYLQLLPRTDGLGNKLAEGVSMAAENVKEGA